MFTFSLLGFPCLKSRYIKRLSVRCSTVLSGLLRTKELSNRIMKTSLVLCLLIVAVCAKPESTYDTRYDDFDVESLVENVRLLKSYGHCFLSTGPCTPEGSDFKKTIPDALKTGCGKCSAKQRHLIRVVVKGFQTKTPDIWQQLVKKEDPTGEYKEIFTKFLNSSD